jgi:hypothetical protein
MLETENAELKNRLVWLDLIHFAPNPPTVLAEVCV